MYVYSEFSEKPYRISGYFQNGSIQIWKVIYQNGCCHSHSRALSLLFGAVACIVVVLLLDGGGLRLKSSPLCWDMVRVEASLEGHYLKL